jgi:DNA-binding beta-propeller fold protein YncE
LTQAGKLIRQIGQPNVTRGTNDPDSTNAAADFRFYPETNELFVADGYGNRRVLVLDADTGKYKRHWGAFGKKPDESAKTGYEFPPKDGQPSPQLNFPHAIGISKDGLLYLMEFWNRIQVFKLDGTFVRDVAVAKTGRFTGVNFSPDPDQQYLYVSDAGNNVIWFLDRSSLRVVGKLGREGPYAGQFEGLHQFAVDSKGNIYTSEITGQKVQKFVFKGFGK